MQAATGVIPAKGGIFDPTGGRPVHPAYRRQIEPTAASPTQITLQLKALGVAFPNFPELADEQGFRRGPAGDGHFGLGLPRHDDGKLIATAHYDNWDYIEHRLRVVEFKIDPENCPVELDGGHRLIARLESMARSLNAAVCDGLGAPLSGEACDALGDHINAVMLRRYKAAREKRAVKLPDGSLQFPGYVSFQTVIYAKQPGKPIARTATIRNFEVPALHHCAAKAQAFRMVQELKRTFEQHRVERPRFSNIIADALGVPSPKAHYGRKPSRETVVAHFFELLNSVFANGLANTNAGWLETQAALYEGYAERDAKALAEDRATFAERMRSARAAKQAGRQGGAA